METERERKQRLLLALQEKKLRRKYSAAKYYTPYEKQIDFHLSSGEYAERCLGAGNQLGKTLAGSMECYFHASGNYPEWWVKGGGAVFRKPTVGWVGGDTSETIRDTTQKLLVGRIQDPDGIGTGSIPKDQIIECVRAIGIKDGLDHVKVRHKSGGVSLIFFKSYEKGRKKWQGETIDWVWFDEEPPPEIYSEGKTRTNNGQLGQFTMLTFTPLNGMTEIVHEFYQTPRPAQHLTMMTIDDVDHYTDEEKEAIVAGYPPHEREARAKGVPILGSGRIFTVSEESIKIDPFQIPLHWAQLNGSDFGYDHPQGWVNMAWDRDNDVIYITKEYRERETTPEVAAITLKRWGDWVPCAWPHDGLQHDKGSGLQLAELYRQAGLNMHGEHATHEAGGFGTEAGVMEMADRFKTGRLRVFSTCNRWFEEYRLYHRKDGKIVKERDDLMSATRIGCMMRRIAETPPPEEDEYDYDDDYREAGVMGY